MALKVNSAREGALAVCSWSLRPETPEDLTARVRACGLDGVQIDLRPMMRGERDGVWSAARVERAVREAGIRIVSGMIGFAGEDYSTPATIHETGGVRPDEAWEENLASVRRGAGAAKALGVSLVTMHAGFVAHDRRDPLRAVMLERVRETARVLGGEGVGLGLETGQERAETLREALEESASLNVGVNFDPANVILYGSGDPVAAFRTLAAWVRQIHLKDAIPPRGPGEWGTEVPIGKGAVDWAAFLAAVRELAPHTPLVVERETGERRVEDVREGAAFVRALLERARSTS